MKYSFRFIDANLNRQLISLVREANVPCTVDRRGVVHYSEDAVLEIENKIIKKVRDQVFPSWAVLSCPEESVERYRNYMLEHRVPFTEELADGKSEFLIPRRCRPHAWKLPDEQPLARQHV